MAVTPFDGSVTYRPLVALCVLLDLNGTLAHPIRRPSEAPLRPLHGAFDALALLNGAGAICAVVTVQGRIGRGIFPESDFRTWFSVLSDHALQHGGRIQGLYLCPHAPTTSCDCRKPRTVLYEQAIHDLGVTPDDVWVVGDTSNDLEAAHRLGVPGLLVRTGHGHSAERDPTPREAVVDDVLAAARHILERTGRTETDLRLAGSHPSANHQRKAAGAGRHASTGIGSWPG